MLSSTLLLVIVLLAAAAAVVISIWVNGTQMKESTPVRTNASPRDRDLISHDGAADDEVLSPKVRIQRVSLQKLRRRARKYRRQLVAVNRRHRWMQAA